MGIDVKLGETVNLKNVYDESENKEYRIFVCDTFNNDGLLLDILDNNDINLILKRTKKDE